MTLAITLWQPWASLVVHGLKPFEWRGRPCPRSIVGQTVVIHAGAPDPRKAIKHLLTSDANIEGSCGPGCDVLEIRAALDRALSCPALLPRCAGLGTVRIGEPQRADVIYHRHGLRIGGEGPWNFGWPLTEVQRWDEPVSCRGFQGFWPWPLPLPGAEQGVAA